MAGPSQEYLDFLQQGMAAGTLTAKQQENYANAVRNNRFEPQGMLAETAPQSVTDIIAGLQPLEQSQAYADQAWGGEDIRGSVTSASDGSYYGAPQDSYNVQDIQAAADAIRASGQPLTQGNKVYDTGNPALNEALYGPDISRNISGDGTQGFRTPRQFDTNYVGEFFAAIPAITAGVATAGALTGPLTAALGTTLGGAGAGAASSAVQGLISGQGVDAQGLLTGAAVGAIPGLAQAGANALPEPVIDFITELLPEAQTVSAGAMDPNMIVNFAANNPELVQAMQQLPDLAGGLYNAYGNLNELGGGGNNTLQIPNADGSYTEVPITDPGGGVRPVEDQGGGGTDSNDTAQPEASQTPTGGSTQPVEGMVVQDSEKPEDPQGFRWVPTGEADNPEWTLIQIDDPAEEGEATGFDPTAVFGSDNPLINPMTGEAYVGEAVVPTSSAELSQGQVLQGNPTEQVATDPNAVFGSDDPNIDPRTGEAYVDYSTPDDLGGLSSGGAPTGGSGGGTGGGNGTGDGTGDGEGSGDGNVPEMTMGMFGGMLANGFGEFKPFQAGINYQPQMLAPQQIQVRNYLAELFGNR